MTTAPPADPPDYERPSPIRRCLVSTIAVEECDRRHALVPIDGWDAHAAWHAQLGTSNALLCAALVFAANADHLALPPDVRANVEWAKNSAGSGLL